jgi:hypothetical protein
MPGADLWGVGKSWGVFKIKACLRREFFPSPVEIGRACPYPAPCHMLSLVSV